MTVRPSVWIPLVVVTLLLTVSCKKAAETILTPPSDTTAPDIVGSDPGNSESDIAVADEIRVTFSEPMDPTSADGNVTLSAGTINSLTWETDRVLVIAHTPWAEGVEVTVTLGAGLKDANGNGLGKTVDISFWTESSTLLLLTTDPADGSTDVIRNSQVMLLFSSPMNLATLPAATTLMVGGSSNYTFSFEDGEDNWVIMTINEVLPASSSIDITVDTSAQDQAGNSLGSTRQFGFETGVDQDTTPPEIVAVDPANGATIDPNAGFLRITFSESMNTDSVQPSSFNAELLLQMDLAQMSPVWSDNNTVITVALPSQLPAGMPLDMTFENYADRNGVVQTTQFAWSAKVDGTADYYPVIDGAQFTFHVVETEGTTGSTTVLCGGEFENFLGIETQMDGTFRRVDYDNFETKTSTDWEIFRRTAAQVEWVGFYEANDGGGVTDISFSTPLPVLQFPVAAGTFSVTSTATDAEFGTLDINWTGTIVGQEDLPAMTDEFGGGVFWKDTWKVIIEFDVTSGGQDFFSSTETYWFAPTVGIVKSTSAEVSPDESACQSSTGGSWRNVERNFKF